MKNYTIKIIVPVFTFFLLLFTDSMAFQEKKIPKPKPIKSIKTTKSDSTKQEQNRLEIPEILIFGKDKSVRAPSAKRTGHDKKTILPIDLKTSGEKSQPGPSSGEKVPGQTLHSLNHSSQIELRFGTYNSPFLSANHWQQMGKLSLDVEGYFDKSDGQFHNSQFENWMINLSGVYEFNFRNKLLVGGNFYSYDYGLWASTVERRHWNQSQFQVGYNGAVKDNMQYELRFYQANSPTGDDIDYSYDSLDRSMNREKNREISAKVIQIGNNWAMSLEAKTYTNRNSSNRSFAISIPNLPFTNSLSKIALEVAKQINQFGFVKFGMGYQFYDLNDLNISKNRFQPSFEFNWNASPKVRLTGFYQSFYRLTTRQQLLEINPAADLLLQDSPIEDIKSSVGFGLEWQMSPLATLSLSYNYQNIENLQAWTMPDNSDPAFLFRIRTFPKAHLSLFKLKLAVGNLDPYRFSSTILISGSSIDDFGSTLAQTPDTEDIPYLEDVRFPIEFEYLLHPNVVASISGDYLSTRVFELSQPILGKSFMRLNSKISYKKNNIEIYLLGTNILNQKYQVWQNYRENGAQVFTGLKVIF